MIDIKLIGLPNFQDALKRYGEKRVNGVVKELNYAGVIITSHAKKSILRRGSSYRRYKRGGKFHFSSAPGTAPNSDTGLLAASINARVRVGKRSAVLESGVWSKRNNKDSKIPVVRYAKWLEYGTRTTKRRPFMKPAFMANEDTVLKRLKAVLSS